MRTVEQVDRSGRGPDGNPVRELPNDARPDQRPSSPPKSASKMTRSSLPSGNGYVWYEVVASRRPATARWTKCGIGSIERWRDDQIATRLKEKAKETVDKVKAASIADAAAARSAPSRKSSSALRRDRTPGRFPGRSARRGIPNTEGSAGIARGRTRPQWFVFRVTGVTDAGDRSDMAPPTRSGFTTALQNAILRKISSRNIIAGCNRPRRDDQPGCAQPGDRRQRLAELARCVDAMIIEPAPEDFAARYDSGAPQVVWTTLVADLETPVSAFLKIARRRADELPARIGRRRRGARPLFDHRSRAGSDLARSWRDRPRSIATRVPGEATRSRPARTPPLDALRALIAESRIELPDDLAADGGRRVRLSRLRHGAADGAIAERQSRTASACPTPSWCGRRSSSCSTR